MRLNFWPLVPRFFVASLFAILVYLLRSSVNLIIAYASFLAVFDSLLSEHISRFLLPPILRISSAEPPGHFAEVPIKRPNTSNPLLAVMGVIVENVGFSNAENVRVLFNGIEAKRLKTFHRYQLIPLIRSWPELETKVKSMLPKVPIRLSLAMIANYKPTLFNFHFVAIPKALLEIQCPANAVSKFKFEVKAISDNSKAKLVIIEIRFNGTYTKGLNIKLL